MNHRVDTKLMAAMAEEFEKHFDVSRATVVLTAEASGIALATMCAYRYGLPLIYAKKAKSDNIEGGIIKSDIYSYTYKKGHSYGFRRVAQAHGQSADNR